MGAGTSTVDFGAGLAQGLAQAFGQKRAEDNENARLTETRKMELFRSVLPHVIPRVKDFNDLTPFLDGAYGVGGTKPKKGEINPNEILQMVLGPALQQGGGAGTVAPPPTSDADLATVVQGMAAPAPTSTPKAMPAAPAAPTASAQPPLAATPGSGNAAVAAGGAQAPAPTGQPRLRLLSDAEMIERQTSNEALGERARLTNQAKLAREFYAQFKDLDQDFTLYDAMAAVGMKTDYNRAYSTGAAGGVLRGLDAFIAQRRQEATAAGQPFGEDEMLQARTDWFSANRTSTDREAIARADFGLAFNQLGQAQQQQVNQKVEALVGNRAYSRTASSAQATFNAPLTPQAAQQTNLPVGTTGPQVAGQGVLTQPELDMRRSTESLRDTLVDIRDRLIDPALPGKDELGGLLPGAALALRRRSPEGREPVAALEAAVNNVVNVVARTVAQQRGAQTEKDAARAEAAIVSLRDAVLSGDTRESAKTRINESLKIIEGVLGKLPQQAVPQAPAPRADGRRPAGTAPAAPATPGTFTVAHGGKTYTFPTQAALDAFKRGLNIQ